MIRTTLVVLCLLIPMGAHAEGVTFQNAKTTFTLPDGFTPGFQGLPGDGKWDYATHRETGAALRTMLPMSTTITPDEYGNLGLFWAAMINSTPFTGSIAFTTQMDVCANSECKPATFSGALGYSAQGLKWTLPIAATTLSVGGTLVSFFDASSSPRGIIIPTDAAIGHRINTTIIPTTPIPEPATLALLGSGLAMLAAGLRRRKIH